MLQQGASLSLIASSVLRGMLGADRHAGHCAHHGDPQSATCQQQSHTDQRPGVGVSGDHMKVRCTEVDLLMACVHQSSLASGLVTHHANTQSLVAPEGTPMIEGAQVDEGLTLPWANSFQHTLDFRPLEQVMLVSDPQSPHLNAPRCLRAQNLMGRWPSLRQYLK